MNDLVPVESIESKIHLIRAQKVMLDRDLAQLYGVETKQLKRQVKRNIERFPADFMFQLTQEEYQILRRQFGTLRWGEHAKYLPYAFTEQGIAMLSSALNSKRAIQVNILIMRAFVRLRNVLASHQELVGLFKELEGRVDSHDETIKVIVEEIRRIVEVEEKPKPRIGFISDK